jgi:hypothetical protein
MKKTNPFRNDFVLDFDPPAKVNSQNQAVGGMFHLRETWVRRGQCAANIALFLPRFRREPS